MVMGAGVTLLLLLLFSYLLGFGCSTVQQSPLWLFREAPAFRNGRECPKTCATRSATPPVSLCDGSISVHVAMTLEGGYIRGTMAAVLSIVQHAACPENVAFHFVAALGQEEQQLGRRIQAAFPYLRFKVYAFDTGRVKERISPSIRQALEHPLNYVRTYLAEILPTCVTRIIYLDSDLLVFDDIAKLWGTNLRNHPLAAPEYCRRANLSSYFTPAFWSNTSLASVFNHHHHHLRRHDRPYCYFNTGVMVMDLQQWRRNGYAGAIEMWMEVQKEQRIYELGSLPPFLLVFAGNVQSVGHRWNQHGLGGDNYHGRCRPLHPGPVSLLHWSGKGKPWDRLDTRHPCPLDSLWAPYDLLLQPT